MKQLYKTCPTCKGEGRIWVPNYEYDSTAFHEGQYQICFECKGACIISTEFFVNIDNEEEKGLLG